MTVDYQVHGDIAVITLNNAPVNSLNHATRRGVADSLAQALADKAVSAIILTGAGKAFSAGADIKEFGRTEVLQEPTLWNLILSIENASKPVLAAIHTVCMGGGLELALACHYRMAAPGCRVALPEVKLGLIPGAGGTQRLPRVLGVEAALDMVVGGEPVMSERLALLPGQQLFDQMASSATALLDEAMTCARVVAPMRPLPRVRNLPCHHPQGEAYFQAARHNASNRSPHFPAPLKCIDAIEAATCKPFAEGEALERGLFAQLMQTTESQALRHIFMAERVAARLPDVPADTPQRTIREVAVIGAGTMGRGIVINCLNAGLAVMWLEVTHEALDRGMASLHQHDEAQVRKGKLQPEQHAQRMSLLRTTLNYEDLKDADLAIEAVFEDMAVKQAVFQALDRVLKPGAILASNTSTLDLNQMAACTRRPQDVVGLHFFSPAQVMPLLEVVRGAQTAKEVLATVMTLASRLQKTAVVAGVCDGFIGNRMIERYVRQAGLLLDESCTPAQVDQAIEKFGFAMGPFRMSDLVGNDIGWAIRQRRFREKPAPKYGQAADVLCSRGRFGQKTSAGWHDYLPGQRDAMPSADVIKMLEAHRAALGITPRQMADEEIVQRLVFALVNEGAHLLEAGIAARASDIDLVFLRGYGFPSYRGGPMHYADQIGLGMVMQAMHRFVQNPLDDAAFWQPAPLLVRLATQGQTFNGERRSPQPGRVDTAQSALEQETP